MSDGYIAWTELREAETARNAASTVVLAGGQSPEALAAHHSVQRERECEASRFVFAKAFTGLLQP